jgi:hypothetical protein
LKLTSNIAKLKDREANTSTYQPPNSFTEHWNISESEEEHQEQKDNESEFTTDSEMSDADDK